MKILFDLIQRQRHWLASLFREAIICLRNKIRSVPFSAKSFGFIRSNPERSMNHIHSILVFFAKLFNLAKRVVVDAPRKAFALLGTKFIRSTHYGRNLMDLKHLFLSRLGAPLFNIIKLAVQSPTKLFGFIRAKYNSLKTEGNPMKPRELFLAGLANLPFNRKPVVQNPTKLFEFIRLKNHSPEKEEIPM